ncbi:MAG: hypothetical protein ABJG68_14485 [Crocinitomicaceae bacterium]
MKKVFLPLSIIALFVILSACQKKKYKTYIGSYNCEITEHLDSNGYFFDTTYTGIEDITSKDSKHMQFRDLPVPYKYISSSGYFADENFVTGLIWGRQITLRNDSVIYYHHESTSDMNWHIRYKGKKI